MADRPLTSESSAMYEEVTQGNRMVEYTEYRALCDEATDDFRRIGIQGEESYQRVLADPRTVFCAIGQRILPALAPIEYEKMYDAERCRELTSKPQVMLLSLPLEAVYNGALAEGNIIPAHNPTPDMAIVVEEPREPGRHHDRAADHEYIASLMSGLGRLSVGEFVHPNLAHREEFRNSWMAMYAFSVKSTWESSIPASASPEAALELAWREYCIEAGISAIPDENANGAYLLSAKQLRENPGILDALWDISKIGFGKILGSHHPVSMEFTREFFDKQMQTSGIYTAVRYYEGKPVCFGSLALNMDHNDWIDCESTVIQNELQDAAAKGQTVAHFFELISNGPQGMSFSPDILQLYLNLVGRTGRPYKVIFESTNLSSTYIPKIALRQVEHSDAVELSEDMRTLGKLDYWWLGTE